MINVVHNHYSLLKISNSGLNIIKLVSLFENFNRIWAYTKMARNRLQEETPKLQHRSRQVKCKIAQSNQNLKQKITKGLAIKFLAHADELVTTE